MISYVLFLGSDNSVSGGSPQTPQPAPSGKPGLEQLLSIVKIGSLLTFREQDRYLKGQRRVRPWFCARPSRAAPPTAAAVCVLPLRSEVHSGGGSQGGDLGPLGDHPFAAELLSVRASRLASRSSLTSFSLFGSQQVGGQTGQDIRIWLSPLSPPETPCSPTPSQHKCLSSECR